MSWGKSRILVRWLAVAALGALTAGCFQPMYAERADGQPALRERLQGVDLPPLSYPNGSREARLGVEIRNALAFKLYGQATGLPPTHRLDMRLSAGKNSLIVNPSTGLPATENYTLNASYTLVEIASGKSVMSGSTYSNVSYDLPGSYQRFSRSRAFRDAEDRAAQEVADNIQTRLASFFYAGS